ncbi:uncharacterized protein LOC124918763 [Impatiens glandulifera]|uniref:uncharacterized protein LOC124918763 n=1 Tax=Impatiens glandulifera TaxID=253017 RepID=UPI001FB11A80|nr:uncharacterized protein LOC124918763 [Impatiens glandulifera]XP_047314762.1 uncharacterized protein LOC124918763 [Impatiens glandulifera]
MPQQQFGLKDIQMLQQHLMVKQLQEHQRQQNYSNQLPPINNKHASGNQYLPPINGTPIRDLSQMFPHGSMNSVQSISSPSLQDFPNGFIYSEDRDQDPHPIGLNPQPIDASFGFTQNQVGTTQTLQSDFNNPFLGNHFNVYSDQLPISDGDFKPIQNVRQRSTSLDPLEQKILFNAEDTNWNASFGTGNDVFDQSDDTSSFPSLQSGSWSALMQSAVAEASSSDNGMQEEWSGLSFQNMEISVDNQPSGFADDGKQQVGWADMNATFPGFHQSHNDLDSSFKTAQQFLKTEEMSHQLDKTVENYQKGGETYQKQNKNDNIGDDYLCNPSQHIVRENEVFESLWPHDKCDSQQPVTGKNQKTSFQNLTEMESLHSKKAGDQCVTAQTRQDMVEHGQQVSCSRNQTYVSQFSFTEPNLSTKFSAVNLNEIPQNFGMKLAPPSQSLAGSNSQIGNSTNAQAFSKAQSQKSFTCATPLVPISESFPILESVPINPSSSVSGIPPQMEFFARVSSNPEILMGHPKEQGASLTSALDPQVCLQMAPSWFEHYRNLKNGQMSATMTNASTIHANAAVSSKDGSGWPIMTKALDVAKLVAPSEKEVNRTSIFVGSKKRKTATPRLIPWHKDVEHGSSLLQNISMTQLEWAHATNRLAEKVEVEGGTIERVQQPHRSKKRIILTTGLMQQIFRPAEASFLSSDAYSNYDSTICFTAKLALGDACGLTSLTKSDSCSISTDASKMICKQDDGSERNSEVVFSKFVEDLDKRAKKLETDFLRMEMTASITEAKLEFEELEKFAIINRFAKFHCRVQSPVASSSSSGTTALSLLKHPQRYVMAFPMPRDSVPDVTHCLSL